MDYNIWIDLALMGFALLVLFVIIAKEVKKPRGATPAKDWEIELHQQARRIDNDLE